MKLHIFNPEHDLAMASGIANFTAPHAGRRLRADLGYLPALWAGADDCVLVENAAQARRAFGRLRARIGYSRFVEVHELGALGVDAVEPWGWDAALRAFLLRHGVMSVPSESEIAAIRDLSHRRHAITLLKKLSVSLRAFSALSLSEVEDRLNSLSHIVVKAPWSSSGRGVRFISGSVISDSDAGWIRNVIAKQGSIIVEPYYNKVKDLGMEFESLGGGCVRYLGLSLFQTRGGAYMGNIVATEEEKRAMLARYVSPESLDAVARAACDCLGEIIGDRYCGPLGVDMMLVRGTNDTDPSVFLHPCVEINLRRTMGHVALAIPPAADGRMRSMQIELTDKYRFRLRSLH